VATVKGYTTNELVAEEMGEAWTDDLTFQCQTIIAEVEAYIDRYTGNSWLIPSAVTNELHNRITNTQYVRYLYLDHSPVTAITSMSIRYAAPGAPSTTLAPGTDYELMDPRNGIVLLNAGYPWHDVIINTTTLSGYIIVVSYTTSTPVPADIEHAATALTSDWLWGRLHGDRRGLKSSSVSTSGDQFSVAFTNDNVSSEVRRILNQHRRIAFA